MRFTWPLRRTAIGSGTATTPGSDTGSPSGDQPVNTISRADGRAWRSLPPLTETIGEPPLMAPLKPFKAELAGAATPSPILAPLTHGRGIEAPAGLVVGLARSAGPAVRGSLPAPLQRAPLPGSRAVSAAGEPTLVEQTSDSSAVASVASTLVPERARDPIRVLPVVDSVASSPRLDLTRAAIHADPPSGLVRPVVIASPAAVEATPRRATRSRELAARPTAPAAPSAVAGSPHEVGAATAPTAIQRAPIDVPSAPVSDVPRLTIGQARRLGLGAPLASGQVSSGAAPGRPLARPGPGERPDRFGRAAPMVAPDVAGATGMTRPMPTTTPMPRTPVRTLPVSPASMAGQTPIGVVEAQPGPLPIRPRPTPVQPATAAPAASQRLAVGPVSPRTTQRAPIDQPQAALTSARSLRSQVQRAPLGPETARPVEGANEAPAEPRSAVGSTRIAAVGGPVTVHRGPDASALSGALEARSFTHAGEIYLPASHGPVTSGRARSLLAHELTHVVQQRRLGSSLPPEGSRSGQALEAEAVTAERSSSLPLAVPPVRSRSEPASPPLTGAPQALPQRAPEPVVASAPASSSESVTVQLANDVQRAPAGAAASPSAGRAVHGPANRPKHSERELEDLARQLYARIGRRLRRDLIVERERAGIAMDLS